MQEPELLGRPQHDLLAQAGQVDAEQGEVEERLGHEVAVGDGVEGVVEPGREAQLGRHPVGVEGQRRARQGAGAERRHVQASACAGQAVDVPGQRPAVGQQVVGQQDRLGPLEVRVAGQVGVARLPAPGPAGPPAGR